MPINQTHTPGPWHWTDKYPINGQPALTLVHTETHLHGIISIRLEDNDHLPDVEKSDDLRLIAAAPDLVAALEDYISALEDGPENTTAVRCDELEIKAKAALAKARGESEVGK